MDFLEVRKQRGSVIRKLGGAFGLGTGSRLPFDSDRPGTGNDRRLAQCPNGSGNPSNRTKTPRPLSFTESGPSRHSQARQKMLALSVIRKVGPFDGWTSRYADAGQRRASQSGPW